MHCWSNDVWLVFDELVVNVGWLVGIFGWFVYGCFDVSGLFEGLWWLYRVWFGSELIVVDREGYGGDSMMVYCCWILVGFVDWV